MRFFLYAGGLALMVALYIAIYSLYNDECKARGGEVEFTYRGDAICVKKDSVISMWGTKND